VQRLSLRWDELFVALESAASDKVALAAIEPDPRNGTVTISGDGKDYLAALSYVLNLSHTDGLERVQLVRHEQKNEGVSFAVSAAWSAK
jgi:biopolymer transport protein ExbD